MERFSPGLFLLLISLGGLIDTTFAAARSRADLRILADPKEAVARAFVGEFETCHLIIDSKMNSFLKEALRRSIVEKAIKIHQGQGPDGNLRYVIVTDEVGKYRPFTFLVALNSDLDISFLELLIYRESHGYEIARKRFLAQYKGKGQQDRLRPRKDILNIAGSTLSVRGVSRGVTKVLAILNYAKDNQLCPFVEGGSSLENS